MATIEEALKALLVADAGVNAVVAGRVYPVMHPQGAGLPAVVYRRVSGVRVGQHGTVSGLARPRFQFDCLATTYAAAKGLANLVRVALDHYSGTPSSVHVDAILIENEMDGFNFESDEGAATFTVLVDAVVWHQE